mmetsp:Transcript_67726/g.151173  ORF Transcript_67726/g.151173 Transcript_67726/m.151173 type:complete len:434 (-) Transcript_67726:122-1423(-)|eukprot:CAMPEP_0181205920 /NCGR_PEP_ID=MMETSP1096-20121128/20744_1 /TAXON_ID=156174 ORGANISM="Chrysochromulina ericina, Strain CCMP281" /NCGR_SAMPLE_ID=MMETSP1096 /ASSEMBLY_ACC=CAM_ASM_000453 /LENGTH=433 /DNA_ID=CAMNT_0023296755 /DNA_START=725 /DNA_END=2029 /DNA_ORIENTATION=-
MPGWFLFAAFLVLLVLLMLVLVEPARQVSHPGISLPSTADLASLTPRALAAAKAVASDAARTPPLVAAGLCLCLLTQPVFSIDVFSFIPTLAPHTEAHFGWGPTANSILFFSFAFVLFLVAVGNMLLMKQGVPPQSVVLVSLALLLTHQLLAPLFPSLLISVGPFLAWLALGALGYSLALGATTARLHALVDSSASTRDRAGLFQGFLGFSDSVGAALGPLYLNLFWSAPPPSPPPSPSLSVPTTRRLSEIPVIPASASNEDAATHGEGNTDDADINADAVAVGGAVADADTDADNDNDDGKGDDDEADEIESTSDGDGGAAAAANVSGMGGAVAGSNIAAVLGATAAAHARETLTAAAPAMKASAAVVAAAGEAALHDGAIAVAVGTADALRVSRTWLSIFTFVVALGWVLLGVLESWHGGRRRMQDALAMR